MRLFPVWLDSTGADFCHTGVLKKIITSAMRRVKQIANSANSASLIAYLLIQSHAEAQSPQRFLEQVSVSFAGEKTMLTQRRSARRGFWSRFRFHLREKKTMLTPRRRGAKVFRPYRTWQVSFRAVFAHASCAGKMTSESPDQISLASCVRIIRRRQDAHLH